MPNLGGGMGRWWEQAPMPRGRADYLAPAQQQQQMGLLDMMKMGQQGTAMGKKANRPANSPTGQEQDNRPSLGPIPGNFTSSMTGNMNSPWMSEGGSPWSYLLGLGGPRALT